MKAFFILGMHRSGTSALTRVLNIVGLQMARKLLPANAFNETGYWEPAEVVKLNDEIFEKFDRPWFDPKPLDTNHLDKPALIDFQSRMDKILKNEFAATNDFVLKDPRMSRLFPLWHIYAKRHDLQVICLIALRQPIDVAKSLNARDGIPISHGLELWKSYMLEAEFNTRHLPRAVVDYESILTDWEKEIRRATNCLQIPTQLDFEHHKAEIDAYLNTGLRHQVCNKDDLAQQNALNSSVGELHKLFLEGVTKSNHSKFDSYRNEWKVHWKESSPGHQISELARSTPQYHIQQAHFYADKGNLPEAMKNIRAAITLSPTTADYHFFLAITLKRAGKSKLSLEAVKNAVRYDPTDGRYSIFAARLHRELGDMNSALELATSAIEGPSPKADFFHFYANLTFAQNRLAKADAAIKSAIELEPDSGWHYFVQARISQKLGKPDKALECLETALRLIPNNPIICNLYGRILKQQGQLYAAKDALETALRLSPKNGDIYIALGQTLNEISKLEKQ